MSDLKSVFQPRSEAKPSEHAVRRNIASVFTSLATNLWELELLGAEHLAGRADDIIDLSSRSLDQMGFLSRSPCRLFGRRWSRSLHPMAWGF